MSKKHKTKNSRINWPKTPAAKLNELEDQQNAIAAVAKVGRMMTAANAVPMPLSKHLIGEAAREASKGSIGGHPRSGKEKKRAWKEHADNYFETNNAWDEVNGIYVACIDVLRSSLALTPMLREKALLALVKNRHLLHRNILAITRDTAVLSAELAKIHETHKDKKGGSGNQEDMMASCSIFSNYVNFLERYDSALLPLIVHASEQLQEAQFELELVDKPLADTIAQNLANVLNNLRSKIRQVTGAPDTTTPADAETPVVAEPQAAVA